MFVPPADDSSATTRIDCAVTGGYNVKPGAFFYEYCPFCGRATDDGDGHEISVSVPG
ncbi:hypothetical protein [Halorarius halobius]|uniref:hypothetical protein n=1 Tax=Halorarius halobius TaxID=2962671 RepID=UPI0020CC6AD4|nr:hypothetical protein [Halorarius halobius]